MAHEENKRRVFGELELPFKHSFIQGEIYPPFMTEAHLAAVSSFQLRDSDVVITTFPKNGTTWTQKLVQSLHKVHATGHLQDPDKTLIEHLPWIEKTILRPELDLDAMVSPRYLKTHSPYKVMVQNPAVPCRYIYVVRNPKDVCVSLYNHCKGISYFDYDGEFEEFVQLFLDGKVESGDWWQHVKDHYMNERKLDMIFMKYEDMHLDGINSVRKINDFCGLPSLSDEKAIEALSLSSFNSMKNDPNSNYAWMGPGRKAGLAPFMRKGTVGDWKNWFSPEMAEKFNQKTREVFAGTDLTFIDTIE